MSRDTNGQARVFCSLYVSSTCGREACSCSHPLKAQRSQSLFRWWSRSAPHRDWWTNFLRDSGGTGFWHETYFMRGGIEAMDRIGTRGGVVATSFAE